MDEPCSALDPIATRRIEELMIQLKQNYTIAIVTHNMQQAQRVADITAFFSVDISQGSRTGYLVESGPTKALFESPQRAAHQGVRVRPVQLTPMRPPASARSFSPRWWSLGSRPSRWRSRAGRPRRCHAARGRRDLPAPLYEKWIQAYRQGESESRRSPTTPWAAARASGAF